MHALAALGEPCFRLGSKGAAARQSQHRRGQVDFVGGTILGESMAMSVCVCVCVRACACERVCVLCVCVCCVCVCVSTRDSLRPPTSAARQRTRMPAPAFVTTDIRVLVLRLHPSVIG